MYALRRVTVLNGTTDDGLGPGEDPLLAVGEITNYIILIDKGKIHREMVHHSLQLFDRQDACLKADESVPGTGGLPFCIARLGCALRLPLLIGSRQAKANLITLVGDLHPLVLGQLLKCHWQKNVLFLKDHLVHFGNNPFQTLHNQGISRTFAVRT
ncbi:hypothetical protein D3C72_1599730 [compost metagenome]